MVRIGIVGNGPIENIPDLNEYDGQIDIWIGADRGALTIVESGLTLAYAVGDFDSVCHDELKVIKNSSICFVEHPAKKDETDIELALNKAFKLNPKKIYLFGVTGGRLDHELINIQLLYKIVKKELTGVIIDKYNCIQLTKPGHHFVSKDRYYNNISFVPYTKTVKGLSLKGFLYPLHNETISWGSTLCISNELLSNSGTFLYKEGILLIIKSRDI